MLKSYKIKEVTDKDFLLIKHLVQEYWGGEPLIVHDKEFYPSKMEGLIAYNKDDVASFLI